MKQNERFLVYAVTGFLALILVVAVLFGREPIRDAGSGGDSQKDGPKVSALQDLLSVPGGPEAGKGNASGPAANQPKTGLPTPDQVTTGQPLNAGSPLMLAADLVAQQLGSSRRDRTVRFVRAKSGDSLDMLVRRWCGARDPFLAEAKCLNEDLVALRVGQEVAVPWVDDEAVLAAIEAQKPKMLSPEARNAVADGTSPTVAPASSRPEFAEPGGRGHENGRSPAIQLGSDYVVKQGDSLWRIAERTYGRKNADRMVAEIKKANPGLEDKVLPGKKLVMPQAPTDG